PPRATSRLERPNCHKVRRICPRLAVEHEQFCYVPPTCAAVACERFADRPSITAPPETAQAATVSQTLRPEEILRSRTHNAEFVWDDCGLPAGRCTTR